MGLIIKTVFSIGFFCTCVYAKALIHNNSIDVDDDNNQTRKVEIDEMIDLAPYGDAIFGSPDVAVGRSVAEWTPEISQNPEELGNYFEGDILHPIGEGRNGLQRDSSKWKDGVVPYVFHSSVPTSDRNTIKRAMDMYHEKTCIKFVPRSNERDYISIENDRSGCWSSVGRIGGKQSLNLQSGGCTSRIGTPIHELLHALGFFHEQNRIDRDSYVKILMQNIKAETYVNFEKAKPGETTAYNVPYDIRSVLHYSPTAFSKNGQKTIQALVSIIFITIITYDSNLLLIN
jgi:hypothetical protein